MDTGIAKVDWNVFNYIHSANPRDAFQRLTEQLFCYEFSQPYGVYRYYNQPYIETMPIRQDNDVIGFQSKYFDESSNFSDKKAEIFSSVQGAHKRYPDITKIIFYINKEPGMSTSSSSTKPGYIREIEEYGAGLDIQVEWRGLNQIETMLLCPELEHIKDYFFSTSGGIRKAIDQIRSHSKSIFDSIDEEIQCKEQSIKISKMPIEWEAFFNSDKQFLLVYGDGGCGKSALVKSGLCEEYSYPIWAFRATDFDTGSLPEFTRKYGDYTWDAILTVFDDSPNRICVIESAEKVFALSHQETFESALRALQEHGWKTVITIRTSYRESFLNTILKTADVLEHYVRALSADTVSRLALEHGFSLPSGAKVRNLLRNLFYLKLYLSKEHFASSTTPIEFMDELWSQVICDSSKRKNSLNIRRGKTIINMVRRNANNDFAYYSPKTEEDWDAITSLVDSGIIQYDEAMGGYFVCHDVYEEIVLRHIISQAYCQKESSLDFFCDIGDSLIVRRTFRSWLQGRFYPEASDLERFLLDVLTEEDCPLIWKDEVLLALLSEDTDCFLQFLGKALRINEYFLLTRALHLLNTACRAVDDALYRRFLTSEEVKTYNIYRFTKPSGYGWDYLISYVHEEIEHIPWSNINVAVVSDVVHSWTQSNDEGATTRKAGLIALHLYQLTEDVSFRRILGEEKLQRIYGAILNSAKEILPELSSIFEVVISEKVVDHRAPYTNLCKHLLKDIFSTGKICNASPEMVIRLAKLFWLDDATPQYGWHNSADLEMEFGLRNHTSHSYYPSSAFQTPVLTLLQSSPQKAIDFILELFDEVTMAYFGSRLNKDYAECTEIELVFPDGKKRTQIASDRLWKLHRGTSVAPDLLESVLMALERWLCQVIDVCSENIAVDLCTKLLSKSRSVAITAVVTSMVIAYPNKLFPIACILLSVPQIFVWDIHRFTSEHSSNFLKGMAPYTKIYDNERMNSNALPFRKKRLEEIIFEYQINQFDLTEEDFQKRLALLYKLIDKGFAPEDQLSEAVQFVLYRMDLRRMKAVKARNDAGEDGVALVPNLPENLVQVQNERKELTKNDNIYLQLELWSHYRYSRDTEKYSQYEQYESNPISALEDALLLMKEPSSLQISNQLLLYVVSVLAMNFQDSLTEEQFSMCKGIVLDHLQNVIEQQGVCSVGDGTDATIAALPVFISKSDGGAILEDPAVLLLMLMCDWGKQRDWAINTVRDRIWSIAPDLARNLLTLFVLLKPGYDSEVSHHRGISPREYFQKNEMLIASILWQAPRDYPDLSNLSKTAVMTLNLFLPRNPDFAEFQLFTQSGAILWPELFEVSIRFHERDGYRDYGLVHAYLDWLATYLLVLGSTYQQQLVEQLVSCFAISKNFSTLLSLLICKQDQINNASAFWYVWDKFFDRVKELCESERDHTIYQCEHNMEEYFGGDLDDIVTTFLFAMPDWVENIHEWHTLQEENSTFFYVAADSLGHHPGTLYSIARVLNTVGSRYVKEGAIWIAKVVRNNSHLRNSVLQVNTDYYIEEYMQRYISSFRAEIKRSVELRKCVLDILGFLVDRGSTCGFMLRENIG